MVCSPGGPGADVPGAAVAGLPGPGSAPWAVARGAPSSGWAYAEVEPFSCSRSTCSFHSRFTARQASSFWPIRQ